MIIVTKTSLKKLELTLSGILQILKKLKKLVNLHQQINGVITVLQQKMAEKQNRRKLLFQIKKLFSLVIKM